MNHYFRLMLLYHLIHHTGLGELELDVFKSCPQHRGCVGNTGDLVFFAIHRQGKIQP